MKEPLIGRLRLEHFDQKFAQMSTVLPLHSDKIENSKQSKNAGEHVEVEVLCKTEHNTRFSLTFCP